MPKCFAISSKTLFNPKNNPGRRMDVGYAQALHVMVDGGKEDPHKIVEELFRSEALYRTWMQELRKLKTLEEIENHITIAFTGSKIHRNAQENFSPEIRAGVRALAIALCEKQAKAIEESIVTELARIQNLRQIAAEATVNPLS